MTDSPDIRYVEIDGDLYPADRVSCDGRPLPITQEQADLISEILREEYETNPAFRALVDARAKQIAEQRTRGEVA